MTTLRERCQEIANKIARDGMLRQGSASETILEFVLAEVGKSADERLGQSLPLVLYFGNDADREEFIAIVHEVKPNMVARKMP